MLDSDNASEYEHVPLPENWIRHVGERAGYVELLNRAFAMFPEEPWYACWGDDTLCGPEGWDRTLAEAAGSTFIAYGDDFINGKDKCCLPFIGGALVRKVGWLGYPKLGHLYCDTVWHEIGKALNCLVYCDRVTTEHLHWSTGKQPYDQTAKERKKDGDDATFYDFMHNGFSEVVARC